MWWSGLFYAVSTASIKISILLFYRRLSSPFPTAFRFATMVGIVYNVAFGIIWTFAIAFSCTPVEAYWMSFSPIWVANNPDYHCTHENVSGPISAGLSVIGDLYSTLLPLLLVWNLQMARRKKVALYALFSLGFV
jgi:hypothetical protein